MIHAAPPMTAARRRVLNNDPLLTPYAIRINGNVINDEACCAAAALDTRAEMTRMSATASAMNGGTTHSMSIHQFGVGKNQ